MIHQCLLAAWIVLVVTWLVWETWLHDAAEDVNTEAGDQPHQPAISSQQVSYVTCFTTYLYHVLGYYICVLCHSCA